MARRAGRELAFLVPRLISDAYLDRALMEKERVHDWSGCSTVTDRYPGLVLVAEQGDAVVGFAHVGQSDDTDVDARTVGELYALHVLPGAAARGRSALLEAAADRLRGRGFAPACSGCCRDEPARDAVRVQGWASRRRHQAVRRRARAALPRRAAGAP